MPVPRPKPFFESERVALYYGDAEYVVPSLGEGGVDCVLTDPPYSDRTHRDHDASTNGHLGSGKDSADRRSLGYESWDLETVKRVIPILSAVCRGWVGVMTDHFLAMAVHSEMERVGRYTFAPLPYYAPGSRVRLSGDGPSSWTIWIVVSRTSEQARWGTLPGGYVREKGWIDYEYVGGKPVELMKALIRDYSRPSHTVLDPYAGSGTTGIACLQMLRNCILVERDKLQCEKIVERVRKTIEFPNNETRHKRELNSKLNARIRQLNKKG